MGEPANYQARITGEIKPKHAAMFEKFADGLGLPPGARRALGLDKAGERSASAAQPAPLIDVTYPDTPTKAIRSTSQLWHIDLGDANALQSGKVDTRAE